MKKNVKNAINVYEDIAQRMLEQLEQGCAPWRRPWSSTSGWATSRATGKKYSYINQCLLGFKGGEWLTFNQVKELGGKVKKGSKGTRLLSWAIIPKTVQIETEDGIEEERKGVIIRPKYFVVFEVSQCEGIEYRRIEKPEIKTYEGNAPIEEAEETAHGYLGKYGIQFEEDSSNTAGAYYSPAEELVHMPEFKRFRSSAEYYSTLYHELTHSTGHKSRLGRIKELVAFGDKSYSKEELTAEMGACYSLGLLGISTEGAFENSAAYCENWLKALKADAKNDMEKVGKYIVSAATQAEKAVNMIFGIETEGAEA